MSVAFGYVIATPDAGRQAGSITPIVCDITSNDDVSDVFQRFGRRRRRT